MLFSEPKIPQFVSARHAEVLCIMFQCSSASRKFLNCVYRYLHISGRDVSVLFSEPKIPQSSPRRRRASARVMFQCSSASRKFLNRILVVQKRQRDLNVSVLFSEPKIPQLCCERRIRPLNSCFSALQRAENSSIERWRQRQRCDDVSVLFSEPKIPQCGTGCVPSEHRVHSVSVLFSEPKIPQYPFVEIAAGT